MKIFPFFIHSKVLSQHSASGAYTKVPSKQVNSVPMDAPRSMVHGSPPDLPMAQRTLHELQRFRALQQAVEAQGHLHGQRPQLYAPYVARMVPSQGGQTGQVTQQNGVHHRHSPPVIPVSKR